MDAARVVGVVRFGAGEPAPADDAVAVEEPLEIRASYGPATNRRRASLSTTLRTPGHDRELVAGFLLAEAVIDSPGDLLELRVGSDPNVVTAELHPAVELDLARLGRHTLTSGACGVCGKTILDALAERAEPVPATWQAPAAWVAGLPEQLRRMQPLFDATGGVHAAGLAVRSQAVGAVYEDIGRHNALDKLLGAEFLAGRLPATECAVVVSGRAGFELVQKCARAGVAVLVAVGAPTSLAVDLALAFGITLVGFARGGRFAVYSGPGRVGGTQFATPPPLRSPEEVVVTDPETPPATPPGDRPPHQWHSDAPQEQPPQDLVKGVTRMVQEARLTLGAGATPEAVLADLKARGLEVTLEEVRADFAR